MTQPVKAARITHAVVAAAAVGSALLATSVRPQPAVSAPLFDSEQTLELTLTLPLRTLIARRNRRTWHQGTASYVEADGTRTEQAVEIRTRGKSRLEVCNFPPLRLDFDRSELDGTLLEGQNRLKLVTQCRDASEFEQYLRVEYLIYRIYEQLSEYAYRVRPLRVRYVDTDRDGRITEAPAFLIESAEGFAARTGLEVAEVPAVPADRVDLREHSMLTMFHFLIGNTDYSAISAADGEDCCHNSDIFARSDGKLIAVPYDFDQAGLVNAPYALPDKRFGIRSVRERLYRGTCATMPFLDAVIAKVDAARPRIEALVTTAGLDEDTREYVVEYLQSGFEILDDPELRRQELLSKCSGA